MYSVNTYYLFNSSGNRIPGIRSTLTLNLHPPACTQASLKGFPLVYSSFPVMYVMWQPCCSSWASNGGQREGKKNCSQQG